MSLGLPVGGVLPVPLLTKFAESRVDRFYSEKAAELLDVLDGFPGLSEPEVAGRVWELCWKHGEQVLHDNKKNAGSPR